MFVCLCFMSFRFFGPSCRILLISDDLTEAIIIQMKQSQLVFQMSSFNYNLKCRKTIVNKAEFVRALSLSQWSARSIDSKDIHKLLFKL